MWGWNTNRSDTHEGICLQRVRNPLNWTRRAASAGKLNQSDLILSLSTGQKTCCGVLYHLELVQLLIIYTIKKNVAVFSTPLNSGMDTNHIKVIENSEFSKNHHKVMEVMWAGNPHNQNETSIGGHQDICRHLWSWDGRGYTHNKHWFFTGQRVMGECQRQRKCPLEFIPHWLSAVLKARSVTSQEGIFV